jgi:hypothetical protein
MEFCAGATKRAGRLVANQESTRAHRFGAAARLGLFPDISRNQWAQRATNALTSGSVSHEPIDPSPRPGPACPAPRREAVRDRERPSNRHIWVAGYWRHDRGGYDWVPGHWEQPPRDRRTWVEPRWENRGGVHVFIEGTWR